MNTFKMGKALLALLLALLCADLLPALPVDVSAAGASTAAVSDTRDLDSGHVRSRRKVGNVTNTPRQYMEDLLSTFTTNDNRPIHREQDPTDVWCFLDKDIIENNVREKSHMDQRCLTYTSYVFNWKALMDHNEVGGRGIPVQRGLLRVYVQAISRHLEVGENVTVNITVFVDYSSANHSLNTSEPGFYSGQQEIVVDENTNEWLEVNITQGLQSMWPPRREDSDISVVFKLSVDCNGRRRKVPAMLANPAEIPLEQEARRKRNMNAQPLLVVFFSDKVVKEKVKEEQMAATALTTNNGDIEVYEGANDARRRRSGSILPCKMYNFTVDFRLIGLYDILLPREVNIRKCVGSCTHTYIKRGEVLSNNYAKIMASATVAADIHPENWRGNIPVPPCCTPTRHRSVFLMIQRRNQALELKLFSNFIAEECGCL